MKKFLSNNDWWFYFVLTYLISWPIWALGNIFLPENLTTITCILGAFGPFIAAMIILSVTGGTPALKQWLKTTFNFKVSVTWYLLGGIILPFVIAGIHHVIYLAVNLLYAVIHDIDMGLLQIKEKHNPGNVTACRYQCYFQILPHGNQSI
jgi:phosphotransferase system  glucose/maltose/N-acetylglucosamine-specific IIC component